MAKVMKMLNFKSNKLHKDTRGFPLPQGKDLLEETIRPRPEEEATEEEEEEKHEVTTNEENPANFAGDKRRVSISKSGRFTLKESQKRAALTILNHDDVGDDEGEDGKAKKAPSTNNENKKNMENDKENVEIRTKSKELKNQVNEERRESCCSVLLDGNAVVAEIESLAIQEQSRQATLVTDL
ncbi:uncharacterized protein LOC143039502 [Oratosquilla oratoria]|uniref:uncharacterized protein LOC143039502 n=1 Tax=Oratosquilla oratoria TaxID=337810 RepID=UPI003F76FE7D